MLRKTLNEERRMNMAFNVIINGIQLLPYKWQEADLEAYVLTIDARLTKEQFERLTLLRLNTAEERKNFDVVINDYLKQMYFSEVLYSQHGEYVKVRITLVEKENEEEPNRYLEEPGRENMLETLAALKLTNEKLLALLMEKGVLTEAEVSEAARHTGEELYSNKFRLLEVDDVDYYDQKLKAKEPFFR